MCASLKLCADDLHCQLLSGPCCCSPLYLLFKFTCALTQQCVLPFQALCMCSCIAVYEYFTASLVGKGLLWQTSPQGPVWKKQVRLGVALIQELSSLKETGL